MLPSEPIYTARMRDVSSHCSRPNTILVALLSVSCVFLLCLVVRTHAQEGEASFARFVSQTGVRLSAASAPSICAACIHANMSFLASDVLQGRGSGTRDEWIAASYIASQLELYGVEPAGENGSYFQRAVLLKRKLTKRPQLTFRSGGKLPRTVVWTHGKQILAVYLGAPSFSGLLQKIDVTGSQHPPVKAGAVVLLKGPEERVRDVVYEFGRSRVSAVIVPESTRLRSHWNERGSKLPEEPIRVAGANDSAMLPKYPVIAVKNEYLPTLERLPEGAVISMKSSSGKGERLATWNVVARIRGSDPSQEAHAILLSAHLDHLGIGAPVNGDKIYNGADDDASGTAAVLEFARVLASQPKPRRTVMFAFFGSEELGGLGSSYFREHSPVALKNIDAYLEFEMIGRPDSAVSKGTLWLTGWERSNLGPALTEHGAKLVGDPHPNQGFFQRSDNYVFAKAGVVAQTVSSYGLHKDYHQPSDDLAHIDFQHMDHAIESLLEPLTWLVNSDFVPQWSPGKQP
jgi:aminopeptidase YwaD